MSGFIEGEDRRQATLLPESLDDYIQKDCPVRIHRAGLSLYILQASAQ
jgi:hypothetical protein